VLDDDENDGEEDARRGAISEVLCIQGYSALRPRAK